MTTAALPFVTRDQAAADAAAIEARREAMPAAPVGVHLWPSAPGLEAVGSRDERRWRWIFKPAGTALRMVLKRLDRGPQLVEAREHGAEVDIIGEHSDCPDDGFLPLATFFEGVTYPQIAVALQELVEANWRPRPPAPQSQNGKAA